MLFLNIKLTAVNQNLKSNIFDRILEKSTASVLFEDHAAAGDTVYATQLYSKRLKI
jgi:hypothetical protein